MLVPCLKFERRHCRSLALARAPRSGFQRRLEMNEDGRPVVLLRHEAAAGFADARALLLAAEQTHDRVSELAWRIGDDDVRPWLDRQSFRPDGGRDDGLSH